MADAAAAPPQAPLGQPLVHGAELEAMITGLKELMQDHRMQEPKPETKPERYRLLNPTLGAVARFLDSDPIA